MAAGPLSAESSAHYNDATEIILEDHVVVHFFHSSERP